MALTKIDLASLSFNPFTKIKKQWMLLSAGSEGHWNTMTANWGGLGELWYKPVATAYVRHSRYTHEFTEGSDYFTLTFLQEGHQEALNLLGSKSGRDIDKMHGSGLTPEFVEGQPTFAEAELVFVCKKLYAQDIVRECFKYQETIDRCYGDNDFHTMYIGEIVACYQDQ
ncbi:flavin reductase family protein [Intestinibacillus massiliensis]|uniref:flavin reductase family protein n=1 Tax=Intestinibacillus massiliensis TaxID=1871029 RepID=UPI000B35E411|nr:flavin reductase family protein [Intestinibacillus massiliensis]